MCDGDTTPRRPDRESQDLPDQRNRSLDLGDIEGHIPPNLSATASGIPISGVGSSSQHYAGTPGMVGFTPSLPDVSDPKDQLQGHDDLEKLFTYQPSTPDMRGHFEAVSYACLYAARMIVAHCPSSADRTLAIQHLVDARMRANMSIALRGARLIPMG
jgi:hypothetical protein